mmetsp:Transcript_8888/g.27571  ORF Transcript_8888/g.27571 Transcript_8888/m.27571 type:complete len:388 (-) Transcript_8888:1004-2167(-)
MGLALGGLQLRVLAAREAQGLFPGARRVVLLPQLALHFLPASITDLHPALRGRGLQDLQAGQQVPEEVVPLHFGADNASDALPVVDANAARHLHAHLCRPIVHGTDHVQAEEHNVDRQVVRGQRPLGHACNVGVPDRLHLVDAVLVREHVEGAEKVAHELHHLRRLPRAGELREAAEVGLRDRGMAVLVRGHGVDGPQLGELLHHERRHQRVQDVRGALPRLLHGEPRLEPCAACLLVLVCEDDLHECQSDEEQLTLEGEDALVVRPGALGPQQAEEFVDARGEDHEQDEGEEDQRGEEAEGVPTHLEEDKENKVQREDLIRGHVELLLELAHLAVGHGVAEDQRVVGDVDEHDAHARSDEDARLGQAWIPLDPVGGLRHVPPDHLH